MWATYLLSRKNPRLKHTFFLVPSVRRETRLRVRRDQCGPSLLGPNRACYPLSTITNHNHPFYNVRDCSDCLLLACRDATGYRLTLSELAELHRPLRLARGLRIENGLRLRCASGVNTEESRLDFDDAVAMAILETRATPAITSYGMGFDLIENVRITKSGRRDALYLAMRNSKL